MTRDVDLLSGTLTAPLAGLGLDLEAVEITPAGKRRLVRVAVDKDGGINLDDIAEASREISRALDESDVLGEQPYTLEVTSPGVDRPLTLPRHWRRNLSRLVKVTTADGTTTIGRISEAGETHVVLDVDGESREVQLSEVRKARVQVEFTRPGASDDSDAEDDITDDIADDDIADDVAEENEVEG